MMKRIGCLSLLFLLTRYSFADSVAIKNFREIYQSLIVATGVTPDADLIAAYSGVRDGLPKFGNVDEFSAPMVMAVTQLASLFCNAMITSDAGLADPSQRRAHKGVDFTKGMEAMTPAIRTSVLHSYTELYWQRDPTPDELKLLLSYMDTVSGADPKTTQGTTNALLLTCTLVSSSLDFLTR